MEPLLLWKTVDLYYCYHCYYLLHLLYSLLSDSITEESQFSDPADYTLSHFVLFLTCYPRKMD